MDNVFHGARDFSDMFIKEEPIDFDDDDVKEEFDTFVYRDDVKIEMASDDSSADESISDNENGEDISGGSGGMNMVFLYLKFVRLISYAIQIH